MAVKLNVILKKLIEQSGIDANSDAVKPLLALDLDVTDAEATKLTGFLDTALTLDGAKNNSHLKDHFTRNSLLPIDSEVERLATEFGYDSSTIDELKAEKSTYKKITKLAAKIKELEVAKAWGDKKGKDALTIEVEKLNAQILSERKTWEEKVAATQAEAANSVLDFAVSAELAGQVYADAIPESIRVTGAKDLLAKELAAKGAKIIRTPENKIKIVNAANPELTYMENNKEVPFVDFAKKAIHPMLKVSDAGAGKPNPIKPIIQGQEGKTLDVSNVKDFNDAQAAMLTAAPAL